MKMHIVYSADDNYARHAGVSMLSLLDNNRDCKEINLYMIDNAITPENKARLASICESYGRRLEFIPLGRLAGRLQGVAAGSLSVSSYARLFLADVIRPDVDKILYFDCDSVIAGALDDLWSLDTSDCHMAGVSDTVSGETRLRVGMAENSPYINAGMVVMNLRKWREDNIGQRFVEFIDRYGGRVFHHDQGVLNGVLHGKCLTLHPKYNAMSVFFSMSRADILSYYGLDSYYTEGELDEAIRQPVFVHFTPAFVNRPWVKGCRHPLRSLYLKYQAMSPWKDVPPDRDSRKPGERLVAFLYNRFPYKIAHAIGLCLFGR